MLVAGLVLLFLSGAGFGAMLGWQAAVLVARLRAQYRSSQLAGETADARRMVEQITLQAQGNLCGLVAEGLSRRR